METSKALRQGCREAPAMGSMKDLADKRKTPTSEFPPCISKYPFTHYFRKSKRCLGIL